MTKTKTAVATEPRVRPGDLVGHVDLDSSVNGRVFAVEGEFARVAWCGNGVGHAVALDRLTFLERPEAYVCVTFAGYDPREEDQVTYDWVSAGSAEDIADDIKVYEVTKGYTVVSSFVPEEDDDTDETEETDQGEDS